MTSSWGDFRPLESRSAPPTPDDKAKRATSRQKLSCLKCRERKVKCDRIKPCSACNARGLPKECKFETSDGNDYDQITQSYELRKLREENQRSREEIERLKQKLQHGGHLCSGDEDDDYGYPERRGSTSTSKVSAARQRRFKTMSRIDNLYFGTPGLANVINDFAYISLGTQSLTHTLPLPKGRDMYAGEGESTTYPFHIIEKHSTLKSLLSLLPDRKEELLSILDIFQRRASSCSFPHTPHEVPLTKREVECFLKDGLRSADDSPDTLALLFSMLATGLQVGQYERSGGKWVEGAIESTRLQSDVFIGASMQALRIGSFMSRPTLRAVQTLVIMGPYLTNSGRFLDAWTLFGTTIRLAHSIGLHRDPKLLDPLPSIPECGTRQTLWWWMLHMDQQYSVTLGRPLGISGIGDCPAPEPLTTSQILLRLGQFIDYFTILARQILSSNEMLTLTAVDGFTEKIIALWDSMPATLQFTVKWQEADTTLPEWPLDVISANLYIKVQSFIILLNRQRLERTQSSTSPNGYPRSGWTSSTERGPPSRAPHHGRTAVIDACVLILQAFMFFWYRHKAMLICWSLGQQAFNACMLLVIDAWETGNEYNEPLINRAFTVFDELRCKGVHTLAALAVEKISHGLMMLEQRRGQIPQGMMSMSRRQQQQPHLDLDTAVMPEFSADAVMGNNGMFLLEDQTLQFCTQATNFRPLGGVMPTNAHPTGSSRPPTPPSTEIPVNRMISNDSFFGVGRQPPMLPSRNQIPQPCLSLHQEMYYGATDFTPFDTLQPHFPQHRGPVDEPNGCHSVSRNNHSGTGPRATQYSQRLEKARKTHRRRTEH